MSHESAMAIQAWALPVVKPLAELDDSELVSAAADGSRDAFDVLVERHRRTVYQVCYRFVNNHEDATDLSQDVFLRAYRALRNFRGQSRLLKAIPAISQRGLRQAPLPVISGPPH